MTLRRYRSVLTSSKKLLDTCRDTSTPPSSMQNSNSWRKQTAAVAHSQRPAVA
jgi:hypothetical protein